MEDRTKRDKQKQKGQEGQEGLSGEGEGEEAGDMREFSREKWDQGNGS